MLTRRGFIRAGAAAAALTPVVGFPAVVKRRNANELLSHACIGTGGKGQDGWKLEGLI